MTDRQLSCDNCDWTGTEGEVSKLETFAGNREEPPEYEGYCPSCGSNADEALYDTPLCALCSDQYVAETGDVCDFCRQNCCPRCGEQSPLQALSRRDNLTHICSPCGGREALEDGGYVSKYEGRVYWQTKEMLLSGAPQEVKAIGRIAEELGMTAVGLTLEGTEGQCDELLERMLEHFGEDQCVDETVTLYESYVITKENDDDS